MSNDLLYSVGVDANELNTGVDAVEARLAKSGVIMAETPTKMARASADAFKEIFTAEDRLSQFRAAESFRRMTDEEKLSLLRHEALGLLNQIQSSEGQSAERTGLQLEYEKKKGAIYELNQKLVTSSTAAVREQTAEIAQQPGLLGKVSAFADGIKNSFKEMGLTLKGIGIGVLVAQVVSLGREAIENAQKTRDEYLAAGKQVDSATRSMAALGDAIGGVRELAVKSVGFLIGGWTQIGDLIGTGINRMRGISEAQEAIAEASEREAEAAEKRLKTRKEELFNAEAVARLRKTNDEAERKAAFEKLSAAEQINALLAEENRLRALMAGTSKNNLIYEESRAKLLTVTNERMTISAQLSKEVADNYERVEKALNDFFAPLDTVKVKKKETVALVEKQVAKEKEVTAEMKEQAVEAAKAAATAAAEEARKNHIGFNIVGRPDEDLTDRVLEEKARTLAQSIFARERSLRERGPMVGGAYDPFLGLEKNQLQATQAELRARQNIRTQVARFGEDGAARFYGGNIPEFERLLEFARNTPADSKNLSTIARVLDRLDGRFEGLPSSRPQ